MLDRIYRVTATGVMDLVMVQVVLVVVEDGHALEVGSREAYVVRGDETSQAADLRVIARGLDSIARDLIA